MVNARKTGRRACCLAVAALLVLMGMSGAPHDGRALAEGAPGRIIHAPATPPEGLAYDAWKGISYSDQTAFGVREHWFPYLWGTNSPVGEDDRERIGLVKTQEMPVSRFEIVSAKSESLGGEMKLRSGGYVDITVTAELTVDSLEYSYDEADHEDMDWTTDPVLGSPIGGLIFADPGIYPFDRYTGVSLLNFVRNWDAKEISPGEATDSGFVESRVSWNGRTYRLLAREDLRNTCNTPREYRVKAGRCYVRVPCSAEVIYTFRVPADYDGLALAIPRSFYYNPSSEKADADEGAVKELYADILTDSDGQPVDMEQFFYVRLSDLIRHFEAQQE